MVEIDNILKKYETPHRLHLETTNVSTDVEANGVTSL